MLSLPTLVVHVLIGISIGLSSGLFGIGGALVATPLLKLFGGLSALLALASPLPASIPSALSGSWAYYKKSLINFRVVGIVLASAIPLNLIGSYASHYVQSDLLMIATAAVMMYVAITFVVRAWLLKEQAEQSLRLSVLPLVVVGIITGIFSGLLAVGGGIVMVPAFVRIVRMPLKTALATSLFCVAGLALPGTLVHSSLGHVDWNVALVLALSSIPFSFLGARLALKLRNQLLERIYGLFMLCFASYFLWTIVNG